MDGLILRMNPQQLDITKVFVGQSATVTVDALPGEKFTAAVTKIANSGENEGGNSKFAVELTLERAARCCLVCMRRCFSRWIPSAM